MSDNTTFDLKEVIAKVTSGADSNVDSVRFIKKMEIGQVVRHGDCYYHKVADDHPHGALADTNQLADGTSKGSRHIAESPAVCYVGTTMPSYCKDDAFMGPCFSSSERFTVSHPEHADCSFPSGKFQTTIQMDAQRQQKVKD